MTQDNGDIEMAWVRGWDLLWEMTRDRKPILNSDWQPISLEIAQGLIQDAAYSSSTWALESVYYRGRQAVQLLIRPRTDD